MVPTIELDFHFNLSDPMHQDLYAQALSSQDHLLGIVLEFLLLVRIESIPRLFQTT